MMVTSIHPGVTREQIEANTGWPVRYSRGGRRDAGAHRAGALRPARSAEPAPRGRMAKPP